jgi:hypothetical protein
LLTSKFKSLASHRCWLECRCWLWILSPEEAIHLVYGTSVVLLRCRIEIYKKNTTHIIVMSNTHVTKATDCLLYWICPLLVLFSWPEGAEFLQWPNATYADQWVGHKCPRKRFFSKVAKCLHEMNKSLH